jgi:ABC-type dipeptide/oligopeptide/nickel transport system ATPase subunit
MIMGVTAGYRGGWWDEIISFIGNVFLAFPQIVLLLVIITAFGPSSQLGIWMNTELGLDKTLVSGSLIIVAITFSTAPQVARIVRGIVLDLKTRDYIAAAEVRGESPLYIMLVELLPNARGPLIVDACLRLGYVIITIALLGFLSLGLPPPDPDWGKMISDGRQWGYNGLNMMLWAGPGHLIAGAWPQPAGRWSARNLAEGLMMAKSQTKPDKNTPVLECKDVSISYYTRAGEIPAVVDFGLTIMPARRWDLWASRAAENPPSRFAIMQYLGKNGHITGGAIRYKGQDLVTMPESGLRKIRGREIAMVYQEPSSSLNPSMKIGQQLAEPLVLLDGLSWEAARAQSRDMLEAVRLPDPDRLMESYPHQISGGQQQRVVIAMALLSKPALLLMDEPTTALDVTVEAGIVELVKDGKRPSRRLSMRRRQTMARPFCRLKTCRNIMKLTTVRSVHC